MSELYVIEAQHLARLKIVAKRLYTEMRMNGDEMRDLAHTIEAVTRFAEEIGPLSEKETL